MHFISSCPLSLHYPCLCRWPAIVQSDIALVDNILGNNPVRELQDLVQHRDMFLLRVNRLVQDREEQSRREEVTEPLNKRQNEEEFVGNTSDIGGEGTGTEGGGGDESSQPSEFEREDRRVQAEKKKRRRKSIQEEGIQVMMPINMLQRLGPLFTQLQVSHNAAAKIVSAMYNEVGVDLDKVTVSSLSSKRLRTQGNNFISEKSLLDLSKAVKERNIPLSVFIDGKK